MSDFIACYRVSTDRQGVSGLGLEVQRVAVLRHVGPGQLAAEYTETETGKKHMNRPVACRFAGKPETPRHAGNSKA